MNDTIKVIICDDHFFYRQGVKTWLESKEDIDIIGESEDGLKLIKQLKHIQPDVILLDINMPVMDGAAALVEIKKLYPYIKVVMLTMNDSKQMVLEMLKLGADGYLTKNDDCEEIYNAIVTCKNEGQYITKKNSDVLLQSLRSTPKDKGMILESVVKDTVLQSVVIEEEQTHEKEQIQIKPKKFSIKNVLLYSLITTLMTGLVIFALHRLKLNMSSLQNIESPITYINN
jgi:DNA-binding NarL/FixJ family response regulator